MSDKKMAHLHCHTRHSFLDGQSSIKKLVARVKELGMESLAVTNHGNIFCCVEFYQECKKVGIKPIMGMEAYLLMITRIKLGMLITLFY